MEDKEIEELLDEIDSLWLYHRHLHKTDDGFEMAKSTNLEGRIRDLEKKYKKLTGKGYIHFRLRNNSECLENRRFNNGKGLTTINRLFGISKE